MLEISFEVNGRKVRSNNIKNSIEAAILQEIKDSVKNAVGSLRCQEHGQAPKVVFKGRSFDKLEAHVYGCCEELIAQVEGKLK